MADNFNWCHGPECHTYTTSSRVRGTKGNKVLRTIKIKVNPNYHNIPHSIKPQQDIIKI